LNYSILFLTYSKTRTYFVVVEHESALSHLTIANKLTTHTLFDKNTLCLTSQRAIKFTSISLQNKA